ncbi:MAG TPA: TetR/AcrR family transcriptional regulator [Terracidiphilus sp.]|nr:TetR/AcrR family transcriptional regulator [Terracidiphilus sp.]
MAFSKVNDEELAGRALEVFRNFGYEGTSLNRLAEATGLEKASFYYRFPGGKRDIVLAVAAHVNRWFRENVLEPLAGTGTPRERVQFVARRLRTFYGDGSQPCVLDTLSLTGGPPELQAALDGALHAWLSAFTSVARESGLTRTAAERRAQRALVNIEGSLVLARVLKKPGLFLRELAGLPVLLTSV